MYWCFLALAIASEVFGSTMLKLSDGFSRPLPIVGVIIGFSSAFYFLSLALKAIPLGTAYAIWAGIGLILTVAVSVIFFNQKTDWIGLFAITLILLGVIILNVFSDMGKH